MGKGGTPPMPAPPAPPPSVTALESVMAARESQKDAAKRRGMASTILAGAGSPQNTAPVIPGQGTNSTLGG